MTRILALLLIATLARVAAADEVAVRVMSTVDVDARFEFVVRDTPIRVRGRANSERFAGVGLVFDGRPVGPLQLLASVDVWWNDTRWRGDDVPPVWRDDPVFESAWRGECALEVGAIHHDPDPLPATLRGYLRFATTPSAQLWESTAGGNSLGQDFAWIAAAGLEVRALLLADPDWPVVRFDLRFEAGAAWSVESALWMRALAQVAIGPALIGVEIDTLSGPRATPLDWRSLASVARLFVGFEWRT